MAKTAERKLEVARRIHDIVTGEYGLPPERLVFDDLTFTLATGDPEFARSGIETIEGIRRIKAELPGVLTSLGVSNVSFGLSKESRAVLNSVFLYHCVQAGLDMAIVNPAARAAVRRDRRGRPRELAEDLIFDRDPQALATFIDRLRRPHLRVARARRGGRRGLDDRGAADPLPDPAPQERGDRGAGRRGGARARIRSSC